MKKFFLCLSFLMFSGYIHAQSLKINSSPAALNDVLTAEIGVEEVYFKDGNGTNLTKLNYSVPDGPDPSLKVYALPDGSAIVRENIVNFLFFDSFGKISNSISNSSNTQEGEATSELERNPSGETIVLYSPKIKFNGKMGSGAKVLHPTGASRDIFYSQDRTLKMVKISDDGEMIAFVTEKSGKDDAIVVMDKFGNEFNTFTFDQKTEGLSFSDDDAAITIYSNNRAVAYSVVSGNKFGSTSFRSPLHFAEYIPDDNVILGLTAAKTGNRYSDIQLHAVNVKVRKIAHQDYSPSLNEESEIVLSRKSKYSYELTGFDKVLKVKASF